MLMSALNGFRSCVFCYGQTGSGKTHTLFGPPSVSLTCVEIYQEQLTDLFTGNRVQLRGGSTVYLEGAAEMPVASYPAAVELLQQAQERKHFAETAMNHRSSRAHTVLIVTLEQRNAEGYLLTTSLHLVDLAGSEQLKLSKAEGQRKKEAVGINSSLSVLGKVITALVEGHQHVPYLESSLTTLLRGALGGNSLTTVVVTASSDPAHGEQTVNTATVSAGSFGEALAQIDASLQRCERVLADHEARGLTHLPAFAKVREQQTALTARRARLLAM